MVKSSPAMSIPTDGAYGLGMCTSYISNSIINFTVLMSGKEITILILHVYKFRLSCS